MKKKFLKSLHKQKSYRNLKIGIIFKFSMTFFYFIPIVLTDLNGFTNSVIIYLNINGFLRFKAKKDKESHTFLNMYVKAQKFDYKIVKSLP